MSKASRSDVRYDRRVSDEFLTHFAPGGVAASLADYAKSGLFPVDLRFRKDVTSGAEHATLYVGLTSVLDVLHSKAGKLRLKVHPTHQKNGKFNPAWATRMTRDELAQVWPDVELYLDRIIPMATRSHGNKEGAVQAAVAAHRSAERIVLDREVTPSFRDTLFRQQFMEECQRPILDALEQADLGFAGVPAKLGNECDALAIDGQGRVLAIEIKPLGAGTIAWVAAQAAMYARIMQRWIEEDSTVGDGPVEVLSGIAGQRHRVRLAPLRAVELAVDRRVVPVVALQRGASPVMIQRMLKVRSVLDAAPLGVEPIEIYEVNLMGELIRLDDSRHDDGRPKSQAKVVSSADE
jgi:hypothetical protein